MVYHYLQHEPLGNTLLFNLPGEKLGPGSNVSKRNYLHFSMHLIKAMSEKSNTTDC